MGSAKDWIVVVLLSTQYKRAPRIHLVQKMSLRSIRI
jgi:hypothetical protein